MDMADYSEALDPAYTTLEFENMQVLPLGAGESHICGSGIELWNFYWFKTLFRGEFWQEVIMRGHLSICPFRSHGMTLLQRLSFITSGCDSKTLRALLLWDRHTPKAHGGQGCASGSDLFQLAPWLGVTPITSDWYSPSDEAVAGVSWSPFSCYKPSVPTLFKLERKGWSSSIRP